MTIVPDKLLEIVVRTADDRRAENIIAFDVRGKSIMSDYFVVLNGTSNRQNRAIAQSIIDEVEENGGKVKSVEGLDSDTWALIDLGDVIVHVFSEEARDVYNIEKLWTDAELVDLTDYVVED